MPVDPVRDAAIDVLLRVSERDVHLDVSLNKTLRRKSISGRGGRFLSQLVYGTTRHRLLCDHVLRGICHQPLEELPAPILAILRMGVFQALFCHQVTFPAMVHTSVDLAKKRGHAGLGRMVNAVLRKAPQTLDSVELPDREKRPGGYLCVRYSLPRWLVTLWDREYGPEGAEAIAAASDVEAPLTLRVNLLKTNTEQLVKDLARSGVHVAPLPPIPEALVVTGGKSPIKTKWFQQGHFTIQDPASMLAGYLLSPAPDSRILDVCAAPGGKTTHLAELSGGQARVVAMDQQANRLGRLLENVERLDTPNASVLCGDGHRPPFSGGFDRVLVDAPCSGLGTLRRHPDIKWRMTPDAIARLADAQRALLRSSVALCENGGLVVYSVCTFSRQETVEVAEEVLAEKEAVAEDGPEWLDPWKIARGQYRILPSKEALDGFFLMRLRKRS